MPCSRCGQFVPAGSRFCPQCGAPVVEGEGTSAYGNVSGAPYGAMPGEAAGAAAPPPRAVREALVRPRTGRMIAGVCAAFARAYGWDVTLVRILLVVITLVTALAAGVIAYVIAWIVIPEKPQVLPPVRRQ